MTFSNVDEPVRVLRGTLSLLRCFFFFDLCWLLSGIGMIILAVTNNVQTPNRSLVIVSGGALGFYASISALVNSLASHGMRTWRRGFLLPWLGFYMTIFCLLVSYLANSLYENRLRWNHVFLFLATFAIYSCLRHVSIKCDTPDVRRLINDIVDVQAVQADGPSQARGKRGTRGTS